jgi:hypothetical protein
VTEWTDAEDQELMEWHRQMGTQWGKIGAKMGNRSAPDVKNHCKCVIEKRRQSRKTIQTREPVQASPEDKSESGGEFMSSGS